MPTTPARVSAPVTPSSPEQRRLDPLRHSAGANGLGAFDAATFPQPSASPSKTKPGKGPQYVSLDDFLGLINDSDRRAPSASLIHGSVARTDTPWEEAEPHCQRAPWRPRADGADSAEEMARFQNVISLLPSGSRAYWLDRVVGIVAELQPDFDNSAALAPATAALADALRFWTRAADVTLYAADATRRELTLLVPPPPAPLP